MAIENEDRVVSIVNHEATAVAVENVPKNSDIHDSMHRWRQQQPIVGVITVLATRAR